MATDTKIIYYGVCLDSNDPLMAGRIRAVLDDDFKGESPKNYDESKLAKIFNGDVGKSSDNGVTLNMRQLILLSGLTMTHMLGIHFYRYTLILYQGWVKL